MSFLWQLIPVNNFVVGFTTCESISHAKLEHVTLGDSQLGVHKVTSKTTHKVVQPPASAISTANHSDNVLRDDVNIQPPTSAWEALYPKGSINPAGEITGGFGFYLSGTPAFATRLESASEAVFSYRMMLQEGWEWVKGGKLPGVCKFFSRCRLNVSLLTTEISSLPRTLYDACFCDIKSAELGNSRMDVLADAKSSVVIASISGQCGGLHSCTFFLTMPKSVSELYAYLPLTPENATQLGSVPPRSIENSDYGFSVGRGAFHLDRAVGRWVAIAFRVKLNDIGTRNGEIELWIDGNSAIKVDGLTLRDTEAGKIKGMHFQTFFGGHGKEWASPKDQRAWFADVTAVILH